MVPVAIFIIATTSLIVELVAFSLLLFGYSRKRIRKYRQHGIAMTLAVVLHLAMIFGWMIASFVMFFSRTELNLGNILQVAALVHVGLGAFAVSAGIRLVGSWRLRADVQECFGRRRLMLTTIVVWSGAMLLGILLYAILVSS